MAGMIDVTKPSSENSQGIWADLEAAKTKAREEQTPEAFWKLAGAYRKCMGPDCSLADRAEGMGHALARARREADPAAQAEEAARQTRVRWVAEFEAVHGRSPTSAEYIEGVRELEAAPSYAVAAE